MRSPKRVDKRISRLLLMSTTPEVVTNCPVFLSKWGGKLHPSPKNVSDVFILIIFYCYYLFLGHPIFRILSSAFRLPSFFIHPPIKTVNSPKTMLPPCAVLSPKRAAGIPSMSTEEEPIMMESGGPAHVAISPT